MARKTYTEEDRARVRQALLDTGLNMAVSKGLKGLHLAELAAAVGISKPYFYTFFDSLEDFSLQMMEEQRCRLLRLLEQELARPEGTWEEHVESFFRTIDHPLCQRCQQCGDYQSRWFYQCSAPSLIR